LKNTIHFPHLRSTFEKYNPLFPFINQLVEKSLDHWDRYIVLAYALFGVFAISAAIFGPTGRYFVFEGFDGNMFDVWREEFTN
jgi:hypothetical protein